MNIYNVLGSISYITATEEEFGVWLGEHTTNTKNAGATSMKMLKRSEDSYYFTYQFPETDWSKMQKCFKEDFFLGKLKGKAPISAIDTPTRWLIFFEEGATEAQVEENSSTRFSVKLDFLEKMETVF